MKNISLFILALMLLSAKAPDVSTDAQTGNFSRLLVGGTSVTSTSIGNWNTAYGWGNHAGLYVSLTGSYTNPSWLNSIPFSKISSLPTTLSGYGITDATSNARTAISLTTTGSSGAATYNNSTGVLNIPTPGGGTVTSVGLSSTDFSVSGSPVTSSGSITANLNTSGVSAGTYDGGQITVNNKGVITAASAPSFNNSPGRSLSTTGSNNTFTISSTKNARVNYTINFSIALTLTTSNGVVSLDYSTDAGSTWTSIASVSSAYTVAVTLTSNGDNNLSGEIPANALVRIYRSSNTNATVTITKQQEVTY